LELTATQSVLGAFIIALGLAALHLAAPRIRRLPGIPETVTGSFAGGLAVAYVFLHLLPELAEGNESVGEALKHVLHPSPLLDLGIFVVALAGFTAFYGLERLAGDTHPAVERTSPVRVGIGAGAPTGNGLSAGGSTTGAPPVPVQPVTAVYWLHLASFMVYNALITYTMPLRLRTGVAFAVLFAIAMGLHFVLTDRSLEEHYPRQFDRTGRLLLAGALLAGWAVAAVRAPSSTLVVALLTALLGGSILLNVFKEEVPSNRRSSFGWFLVGLILYSALLAVVTALAE
jgi:hypothetical protein